MEDTVGSGEKTVDLEKVVIMVIVIIITIIRMTWEVWRILQRTGSWPNYWSEELLPLLRDVLGQGSREGPGGGGTMGYDTLQIKWLKLLTLLLVIQLG